MVRERAASRPLYDGRMGVDPRETDSGIEVKPVYGPDDATHRERPGEFPYTRGPYPDMYRG
ncbi:MAG: methylmalonyl-CoA mutase family protein, partial [Gaiellaceae bacterium]